LRGKGVWKDEENVEDNVKNNKGCLREETRHSGYFLALLVSGVLAFFISWPLPFPQSNMAQYGKTQYWDERYMKDPEPFDWWPAFPQPMTFLSTSF
jgi:hypothetical protein